MYYQFYETNKVICNLSRSVYYAPTVHILRIRQRHYWNLIAVDCNVGYVYYEIDATLTDENCYTLFPYGNSNMKEDEQLVIDSIYYIKLTNWNKYY